MANNLPLKIMPEIALPVCGNDSHAAAFGPETLIIRIKRKVFGINGCPSCIEEKVKELKNG